jgi:acetyltransferase-like isoleucine patch superfamily enzyme
MKMLAFMHQVYRSLKRKIDLMTHNEYTIAEVFRKDGAQIGTNCRILVEALGGEPYLVKIGNDCTIAPDVAFITHDGSAGLFRKEIPDLNIFGTIEVKDNCFIGLGTKILCNVTIGPNAVVGAGSVVTKDVPPNTVVAGVPARVITDIATYREKCIAQWKKLGLQGPRSTWEAQLKAHFWPHQAPKE